MFDIVALGECLIDFTPSGQNGMGMPLFSQNPGGAPANVLAMSAKLGGKTAFIGKVGNDGFGIFLETTMRQAGIDVSGLLKTQTVHTTLAFVHLDENGERSFSFYRNPGADICLEKSDVPQTLLRNCWLFHFGAVSLTDEPSRSATLFAAQVAKEAGALISFDPNYRPPLWVSEAIAGQVMLSALKNVDILKVSQEEMFLLTGTNDLRVGADELARSGASLVLVTGGERGAYYRTTRCSGVVPAYDVNAIDTTGAGDAFLGAILHRLRGMSRSQIQSLTKDELESIVRFGNAAGGLTATAMGAIPAMPCESAILHCIRSTVPNALDAFAC